MAQKAVGKFEKKIFFEDILVSVEMPFCDSDARTRVRRTSNGRTIKGAKWSLFEISLRNILKKKALKQ